MIYALVFIFGTIIGSFLNVLVIRVNTGESLVRRGSRCMSCGKKLGWFELIPVASFFIQRGRCIGCKTRISRQYPILEALTGIVFTLIFYKIFNFQFSIFNEFPISNFQFFKNLPPLLYYWAVFALLIAISVYDFRRQIIPDKFAYPFIALSFFSFVWDLGNWDLIRNSGLTSRFLAGIVIGVFFASLWFISKGRWMGFGDAKLALGAGWLLGPVAGISAVLLSFWLGAIIAVFLLLFRGKDFTLKSRIPFGPFLALGIFLAFLAGNGIWDFYLNIFN